MYISKKHAATRTGKRRPHYQHQRPKRAIEYYQRALSRAPRAPLILNNLAWTYAEEGMRLHYALELSLQAVKIEADSPVYLDTYAELLHRLGRHQHAIAVIGQARILVDFYDLSGQRVRRLIDVEGQNGVYDAGRFPELNWDCLLYTSPSPRD